MLGLGICVTAIAAANLLEPGLSSASSWVFSLGASTVPSWVTGRILRARRTLAAELRRTNERIVAEQHGREMLAIAEQRTRIARELQALVANSVSAMIVQTQAAQRLLVEVPGDADAAMAIIEDTGRQALAEMRRILGVLRRADDKPDLSPAPGVGQIPALVERARRARTTRRAARRRRTRAAAGQRRPRGLPHPRRRIGERGRLRRCDRCRAALRRRRRRAGRDLARRAPPRLAQHRRPRAGRAVSGHRRRRHPRRVPASVWSSRLPRVFEGAFA